MPRLVNSVPRYRKHRASGQAMVTLSGQVFYLGPHATKTSHREYDRVVAEWLARGRHPLASADEPDEITCVELMAAYRRSAVGYCRKNGKVTNPFENLKVIAAAFGRNVSFAKFARRNERKGDAHL